MDSFALAYQDSGAHVSVAAGITIGLVASFVQSLGESSDTPYDVVTEHPIQV